MAHIVKFEIDELPLKGDEIMRLKRFNPEGDDVRYNERKNKNQIKSIIKEIKMNRKEEISKLLKMTENEIVEKAGDKLKVFNTCDGIYQTMAKIMFDHIDNNNKEGKKTTFILPVGPVEQYGYFVDMVHKNKLSLKNCWFFYMDEYAYEDGKAVSIEHFLSLKGKVTKLFFDKLDKSLTIPEKQLFFPNENNINELADKIEEIGGIDICFGGIGIHGHLAFNEPEEGVSVSNPRYVKLNDFTITINAIRDGIGGDIENFLRNAYTLGMKQILGSRKICLACRNGIDLQWANTVLRLTLLGIPGDDYPCSHVNQQNDYLILTDKQTLKTPINFL